MILDTHGWVLTLCGGEDARRAMRILEKLDHQAAGHQDASSRAATTWA